MNATFGIDLDALIGGDFKADDGWARPLPSRTQFRRRRYPVGRLRGHTTPERNHTVIVDEQLKNWSPTGQPS